jgi:hypothetical protein
MKIPVLLKLHRNRGTIIIERWEEGLVERSGATSTRSMAPLTPIIQQIITEDDSTNPASYRVNRDALVLTFRLLFQREAGPNEGDFVLDLPSLQHWADAQWDDFINLDMVRLPAH